MKPPNTRAAFWVPPPAKIYLAVFKFPTFVQEVPLNFSVIAELIALLSLPPEASAEFWVPAPAKPYLARFMDPVDDQEVPLNFSETAVAADPVKPPEARAAF